MGYEITGAKAIYATTDAIRVEADDFDEPQWIPRTQIEEDSEVYDLDTEGVLIVSEWFARKRGWL